MRPIKGQALLSEVANRLWVKKAWIWECEGIIAQWCLWETEGKAVYQKQDGGVVEEKFEEGIERLEELYRTVG